MNAGFDGEMRALKAAAATAVRAREQAHDRIVLAFRNHLQMQGPGPSDNELQSFARLALVEEALRKEVGQALALAAEFREIQTQ